MLYGQWLRQFCTILDKITTNAVMASFLTLIARRMRRPARCWTRITRELMQLFTIGLYRLNMDGTRVMSGGVPVETYTPANVSGLAQVFTGLNLDSSDSSPPDRYRRPLVVTANQHVTDATPRIM